MRQNDSYEEQILNKAGEELASIVRTCKRSRWKHKVLRGCCLFLISVICTAVFWVAYYRIDSSIPSCITVRAGMEQTISLCLPAKGRIVSVSSRGKSNIPEDIKDFDLRKVFTLKMNPDTVCNIQVQLFGFIPFKQIDIVGIEDRELIPLGIPIGLYVETDGILVVGTAKFEGEDNKQHCPAKNKLRAGDYILAVDGQPAERKEILLDRMEESRGEELSLLVSREGREINVSVAPCRDRNGNYRLGLWIRDNAQGIGTMTYLDSKGEYGALGHGIADVDTGEIMQLSNGTLYETSIVNIRKGEPGTPGEITGMITYADNRILGTITRNDSGGIHGCCDMSKVGEYLTSPLPIGFKQEIQKGPAQILCMLDGTRRYYDVEITAIHLEYDKINKGIELKVTDQNLLDMTGGIIQGMSGSPIIQDGKIIGAVTHVLVNDPERGYGIFIENMLEH